MSLVGWRLIPNRGKQEETSETLAEYIAELTLPPESPHIGKRVVSELYEAAEKSDVAIIGLIRDGKRRYGRSAHATLAEGDALVLEARPRRWTSSALP